jgi:hypothetical protein
MLTAVEVVAYAEATDSARSTRYLIRDTRENPRQSRRVKPDTEGNPLAELDWEKEATWDDGVPQATLLRHHRNE